MKGIGGASLAIIAVLLGWMTPAHSADIGEFQRSDCTTIADPVANQSYCRDETAGTLKVWNCAAWGGPPVTGALPACTRSGLPAPGTPGRLARVTDDIRGLWVDTGTEWRSVTGAAEIRDFGAVGDKVTDDTAAVLAWVNATSADAPASGRIKHTCSPGVYGVSSTINPTTVNSFALFEGINGGCTFKWIGATGAVAPDGPTVTPAVPGGGEAAYRISAVTATGETNASRLTQIENSNGNLTGSSSNLVSWTAPSGPIAAYHVWRTVTNAVTCNGAACINGLIGMVSAPTTSYNDTGVQGDGTSFPESNTTGGPIMRIGLATFVGGFTFRDIWWDCNSKAVTGITFDGTVLDSEGVAQFMMDRGVWGSCKGPAVLMGDVGAAGDMTFIQPHITGDETGTISRSSGIISRALSNSKNIVIVNPQWRALYIGAGVEDASLTSMQGLRVLGGTYSDFVTGGSVFRMGPAPEALSIIGGSGEVNSGVQLYQTDYPSSSAGGTVNIEGVFFTVAGTGPLMTLGGSGTFRLANNYFGGDPPADRKIVVGTGFTTGSLERQLILSEGNIYPSRTPFDQTACAGGVCAINTLNDKYRNAGTGNVPISISDRGEFSRITAKADEGSKVALIAKGAPSQTANLIEAQDSTGSPKASVGPNGEIILAGIPFSALGTPANGRIVYCTDCTIANPCASGGTGAIAKRLNGAWVCN